MPNNINKFHKILVAVDLTKQSDLVMQTAHSIGQAFGSELYVVHVIEPVAMAYNDNILFDLSSLEKEIETAAKNHLKKLSELYHISEANQYILFGKPATKIHALAEEINADLIVIGTHGRSGIASLLGSTANSVLHGSKCNVLTVRVTDIN